MLNSAKKKAGNMHHATQKIFRPTKNHPKYWKKINYSAWNKRNINPMHNHMHQTGRNRPILKENTNKV